MAGKSAIIVAGGAGTRMGSAIPKQFLEIDGLPIIVQTIRKFLAYEHDLELIIVLPKAEMGRWSSIKNKYFPEGVSIREAAGGKTRGESVQSGLQFVPREHLVAIHDAVRPFVSIDTIRESFSSAEKYGSGVAVVPLKDSIRLVHPDGSSTAKNRAEHVLVQTPQVFQASALKEAYERVSGDFTDDASLYEQAGHKVCLVEGSYENIKITTPEDIP